MTSSRASECWFARLALVALAASIAVLLAVAGIRSIGLLLIGAAGTAVALAAVWWVLTRRGIARRLAVALALAGPLTVAALYIRAGLLWLVVLCAVLVSLAAGAGRRALAPTGSPVMAQHETSPPRQPFLIMNPWSGGGKVARFDLVARAENLGARVLLLDQAEACADIAELAREGVGLGADLLGVAGGDGTQALVARVAAEHGIPFVVIPAGTRNHLAMDLGLDPDDPVASLEALTDGLELRMDLGFVGDRAFVNNASFGAYAAVVQSPAYRGDKMRTTLDLLPQLLADHREPRLRLRTVDTTLDSPQAILVSNNSYQLNDVAGLGRRARLDGGVLGVLAVLVNSAGDAMGLIRGRRSRSVWLCTATEVVIDADAPMIAVGIDGEPSSMRTPVRCAISPQALRVRVPRHRPGVRAIRPPLDWRLLGRLAFSTGSVRPQRRPVDGS
jgi:diacylglycerol kinase family enzyme